MMNDADFTKLVTAFWRTAEPEKTHNLKAVLLDAFDGSTASTARDVIARAIREEDRMPSIAWFRRASREQRSHAGVAGRIPAGMVICIGKHPDKGCGEVFPMWTWCPKCYPEKQGQPPRPMAIWPQSSHKTVEAFEAAGAEAGEWYSSRDPRPGDNDPILVEPPHVTQRKLLAAEAAAAVDQEIVQ